jgi:hypothetical protein
MSTERPDPVPDTAMATGNDEGEPGDRFRGSPLDPEEEAMLDELRHDSGDPVVTEAEEDSPAMAQAVDNDSVVPDSD